MSTLNIFSSQTSLGGAMSAEAIVLSFPSVKTLTGEALTGLIIQNLTATWGRPITRLFGLGSQFYYYVVGRPAGQAGLSRIVGPAISMNSFYTQFGNPCFAKENQIELWARDVCEESGGVTRRLSGCTYTIETALLMEISIATAVNDGLINETAQMMMGGLLITDNS